MTCHAFRVVYQQTQRWRAAGCFTTLVDDLRLLLREANGRTRHPSVAILESRTLQSTPESGRHAGYDGAKHCLGSNVHVAVDTLGSLLTLLVTPANEQDRVKVGELAQAFRKSPQTTSTWFLWINALSAMRQQRQLTNTAFAWKW